MGLIGNPPAQALSTQGGRLPIVLPDGLGPLNVGFGRRLVRLADDLAGGRRLLVGDHDPGVGQVDPYPVGMVAEDLYHQAVGLEDRRHQVGLDALAPEDHGPALDCHHYQPSEGSTVMGGGIPPPAGFAGDLPGERGGSGEVKNPAAAIMAALSVHSSSGGMVSLARSPTTSAARRRRSVFAATPPDTTTSSYGWSLRGVSSFSSSASTTERSKLTAKSALYYAVA